MDVIGEYLPISFYNILRAAFVRQSSLQQARVVDHRRDGRPRVCSRCGCWRRSGLKVRVMRTVVVSNDGCAVSRKGWNSIEVRRRLLSHGVEDKVGANKARSAKTRIKARSEHREHIGCLGGQILVSLVVRFFAFYVFRAETALCPPRMTNAVVWHDSRTRQVSFLARPISYSHIPDSHVLLSYRNSHGGRGIPNRHTEFLAARFDAGRFSCAWQRSPRRADTWDVRCLAFQATVRTRPPAGGHTKGCLPQGKIISLRCAWALS